MISITSFVKEDNGFWLNEFEEKQKFLSELFPMETPSAFYRVLFPDDMLQTMDNDARYDGKGNALIYYQLGYKDYINETVILLQDLEKGKITQDCHDKKLLELDEAYHIRELEDGKITHEEVRKYSKGSNGVEHLVYNWERVSDEHIQILRLLEQPRAYITPISYFGSRKNMKYVQDIYAIVLDVDLVSKAGLENLIYFINRPEWVKPTYIVNSGSGVHLYFVLDEPIRLHRSKDAVEKLTELKKVLIGAYWKYGDVSSKESIDAQSIYQSYSLVGSPTKFGSDYRVTAYKVGGLVSIESLFKMVSIDVELPFKHDLTLEEAKKLYPDWTPRSENEEGAKKGRPNKSFTLRKPYLQHRGVYDAELKRLRVPLAVKYGHRYWCLFGLAVTAVKCGISKEEFEKDCWNMGHFFEATVERTKPFTDADIASAIKCYDKAYRGVTLECLNYKTGIHREPNKRNGNSRDVHCAMMRATKKIKIDVGLVKDTRFGAEGGNDATKGGRPTVEQTVRDYLQEHPDAKKAEVIKNTGLSKPTVYKYYNKIKEELS